MSGQRKWLVTWARTVGMPIGLTDEDDPKFLPITQVNVKRALALRTFWIILHVVTCVFIIVGNGRVFRVLVGLSNYALSESSRILEPILY